MNLKVYISHTTCPWMNLAFENFLLRTLNIKDRCLMIWRSDKSVILGRFQNPWIECDLKKMRQDGVRLVRRQSGGGAVYHDLGNVNFSFFNSHKDENFAIVLKALKSLGIIATKNQRNDLLIEGKKISGSAFKRSKDAHFHHATMLINSQLDKLFEYLNPKKRKIISKSILSNRSLVMNLNEINNSINYLQFILALENQYSLFYNQPVEKNTFNEQFIEGQSQILDYYNVIKDWQWVYGETPKFEYCVNLSNLETQAIINCKKGMIRDVQFLSKSLDVDLDKLFELTQKRLIEKKLAYSNVFLNSTEDGPTKLAREILDYF